MIWSAQREHGYAIISTYVVRGHGTIRGKNENDADKERPEAGPDIYEVAEDAHMPRSGSELTKQQFAQNGDAIAPVKSDGAKGEDGINCRVGAQCDKIDRNAEEHGDPDRIEGSASHGRYLDPDVGKGKHAVTGKGKDSSAKRLHGCESHKLDNEQSRNGEEDGTTLAKAVIEDLCDWLFHLGVKDSVRVTHAEAQNDVEQEASQISEQHSH